MGCLVNAIALVCFLAVTVSAQNSQDGQFVIKREKIRIGDSKSIQVGYAYDVATPIQYTSENYTGPYDPLDPKGINAARNRRAKIEGDKTATLIKSYIPPGIEKVAAKEAKSVLIGEGRRFAFAHPKETADLIGIAMKAKNLYQTASDKVNKLEAKEKKQKLKEQEQQEHPKHRFHL